MNVKEWAEKLNSRQHFSGISTDKKNQARNDGIVFVMGASDNRVEIYGAIDDEVYCHGDGNIYITQNGVFRNTCQADDCPYYLEERKKARKIRAILDSIEGSWLFKTDIPHETFYVYDEGVLYCEGIVFDINQLGGE